MDVVIAMILDVLILLGFRKMTTERIGVRFWLMLAAFNAVALVARIVIDNIMDKYDWDRVNANGYDFLLSIIVFLVPTVFIGSAILIWPPDRKSF